MDMQKMMLVFKSVKESICEKWDSFKNHPNNKKYRASLLAAIIVLSLISILGVLHHLEKNNMAHAAQQHEMQRLLRLIHVQLQSIESSPEIGKEQRIKLQQLTELVSDIKKMIPDVAKSSDIKNMSNQLMSVKNDIDSQLNDLKKVVSNSGEGKQYLDISSLPFEVMSVDVIDGRPYVSVNYANHVSPLGISDSLAGWRLVLAGYGLDAAEFVNAKNQFVKVALQTQNESEVK